MFKKKKWPQKDSCTWAWSSKRKCCGCKLCFTQWTGLDQTWPRTLLLLGHLGEREALIMKSYPEGSASTFVHGLIILGISQHEHFRLQPWCSSLLGAPRKHTHCISNLSCLPAMPKTRPSNGLWQWQHDSLYPERPLPCFSANPDCHSFLSRPCPASSLKFSWVIPAQIYSH